MWELCKIYKKLPDDLWFENIDPIVKLWMYESWCQDQLDKNEFARSFSIFLGSFFNPEAAHKMIKDQTPDFMSSDEDFNESTRMILEDKKNKLESGKKKRRRRGKVIKN